LISLAGIVWTLITCIAEYFRASPSISTVSSRPCSPALQPAYSPSYRWLSSQALVSLSRTFSTPSIALQSACRRDERAHGYSPEAQKVIPKHTEYVVRDIIGPKKVYSPEWSKDVSSVGTIGDPTLASRHKGQKMLDGIIEATVRFLVHFNAVSSYGEV